MLLKLGTRRLRKTKYSLVTTLLERERFFWRRMLENSCREVTTAMYHPALSYFYLDQHGDLIARIMIRVQLRKRKFIPGKERTWYKCRTLRLSARVTRTLDPILLNDNTMHLRPLTFAVHTSHRTPIKRVMNQLKKDVVRLGFRIIYIPKE